MRGIADRGSPGKLLRDVLDLFAQRIRTSAAAGAVDGVPDGALGLPARSTRRGIGSDSLVANSCGQSLHSRSVPRGAGHKGFRTACGAGPQHRPFASGHLTKRWSDGVVGSGWRNRCVLTGPPVMLERTELQVDYGLSVGVYCRWHVLSLARFRINIPRQAVDNSTTTKEQL